MDKEEIAKKILDNISENNIKPKPKYIFTLQNVFFWIVCIFAIVLASVITSIMIYRTYLIYEYNVDLSHSVGMMIKRVSFFWFALLVIILLMIFFSIRHTKRGYKYPTLGVSSAIILTVIFMVVVLISFKSERKIMQFAQDKKFIMDVDQADLYYWNEPDKGRLSGIIYSTEDLENNHVAIISDTISKNAPEGSSTNMWYIDLKKARIHPLAFLAEDLPIKIIGKKLEDNVFQAEMILPARKFNKKTIARLCQDIENFENSPCEDLIPKLKSQNLDKILNLYKKEGVPPDNNNYNDPPPKKPPHHPPRDLESINKKLKKYNIETDKYKLSIEGDIEDDETYEHILNSIRSQLKELEKSKKKQND